MSSWYSVVMFFLTCECVHISCSTQGFREAHMWDAVAMVTMLSELERDVAQGLQISELDIDARLLAARGASPLFIDASFATIAGVGAHGAIVHYR